MSVFALKHAPQQVKSFTQDLSIKLFCPDCKKDPPLPLPVPSSPSTSTSTTVTIDENGNQIIIQNETGEGGGEGEQGGNEGAEVVKKENENETSGLGTLIEEFGSGDLLCGQCGLVLGDRIVDTRSEWRSFADSEGDDPSRVGGPVDPLLDPTEQFTTVISFKDGNTGIAKSLQSASRLVTKSTTVGNSKDRNEAYREISTLCEAITLPKSIIDTAKQLFKRVDEEKLLRGKDQEAIIAACIFIACRQGRVARTFKEIVALCNVTKIDIATCFKAIEKAFDTTIPHSLPVSNLDSLITRFSNHLGLPVPLQRACVSVANKVSTEGLLDGRSPITVAGACIYFTTLLWGGVEGAKSGKEIAVVAGVQDGTIRGAYKVLYASKEKLVEQKWFDSSRANGSRAEWGNLIPVSVPVGNINKLVVEEAVVVAGDGSVAGSVAGSGIDGGTGGVASKIDSMIE